MSVVAENLIGVSAGDCESTLMCRVANNPLDALGLVAKTLQYMNEQRIEKISHRRALVKAGRAALATLAEV